MCGSECHACEGRVGVLREVGFCYDELTAAVVVGPVAIDGYHFAVQVVDYNQCSCHRVAAVVFAIGIDEAERELVCASTARRV